MRGEGEASLAARQAEAVATKPGLLNTLIRLGCRLLGRSLLRLTVHGADNVPRAGAVLLTLNHLGGADAFLVVGFTPRVTAGIGKAEILSWPIANAVARAYGMIPVRRGEPDRAALRSALAVLKADGALALAPEGRESRTGALEQGKEGPAFLAQQLGAPIVPIALTGTAWKRVLPAWRRLRRPCVTLTYGRPYQLPSGLDRRQAADYIMRQIAALLPPDYRGVYADDA